MNRALTQLAVMVLAGCLSACTAGPVADPLSVMLDRTRDPVQRLAALNQLVPINQTSDPQATAAALHAVLWSDGQPTVLRLRAMDQLIEYNPDGFWMIARRRIREVDLWPVLGPLIERVVDQGDPAQTVILIRSYTRESQVILDVDRPEREAIASLNPGKSLECAIWNVVVSEEESVTLAERIDAWALLNRLAGQDVARAMLTSAESDEPLILDLQAADWLGRLPGNREGVLWLMRLRSEPHRALWESARSRTKLLTEAQRQGLELRHLPALLEADPKCLGMNRAELLSHLRQRLPVEPYAPREAVGTLRQLPAESLNEQAQSLCWADLLTIELLLEAISDPTLTKTLFHQADADLADVTTEHGGVMVYEHDRFIAQPYQPVVCAHDQKFYSSDALIQRMYTGLFHYHFHAQKHHNADYAGPGAGDLAFAELLRPSAVVFTFLDENTLGADYYQADGVVIDLGVIRR